MEADGDDTGAADGQATFVDGGDDQEEEEEDDVGAVDEYMLKWVEENWEWFVNY
jgi:helicase SWR1